MTPPRPEELARARLIALRMSGHGIPEHMTVAELLDEFDALNLTPQRRVRLEQSLGAAGITVTPSLRVASRGDLVTLALAGRAAGQSPAREPHAGTVHAMPEGSGAGMNVHPAHPAGPYVPTGGPSVAPGAPGSGSRTRPRLTRRIVVAITSIPIVLIAFAIQQFWHGPRAEKVVKDYYAFQKDRPDDAARLLTRSVIQTQGSRHEYVGMLKDSPLLYYSVASSDFRGGNVMDRFEFTDAAVETHPLIARSARYGCRRYEGPYRLKRLGGFWLLGGKWKIDDIPTSTQCEPEEIEESWRDARSTDRGVKAADPGLPQWAKGRLQRINPTRATTTNSFPASAGLHWSAWRSVDYEAQPTPATAWRSAKGRAQGALLVIELPSVLRIGRLRIHNGLSSKLRDHKSGLVDRATVTTYQTGNRQVNTFLSLRPEEVGKEIVSYDCDYGTTDVVTVRVDGSFPATAETVALSDIQLWGVAPPDPIPPPPPDLQEIDGVKPHHNGWIAHC